MAPVMGHLGTRVSALLDGRMTPAEEDRWWQHVHHCHPCRDLVEREGWVKTRLAGLSLGDASAPADLKHSLLAAPPLAGAPEHGDRLAPAPPRRTSGFGVGSLVGGVLGSGAVGVAVVGVLALGAGPANAPQERRVPVTSLTRPAPTIVPTSTPSASPTTGSDERRTRSVRQAPIHEKMGQ